MKAGYTNSPKRWGPGDRAKKKLGNWKGQKIIRGEKEHQNGPSRYLTRQHIGSLLDAQPAGRAMRGGGLELDNSKAMFLSKINWFCGVGRVFSLRMFLLLKTEKNWKEGLARRVV